MKKDYDAAEFNVPARDPSGKSIRISIHIQSEQYRTLAAIVDSGCFPYTATGAAIRHGIQRLIAWLSTLEDVPAIVASFQLPGSVKEFVLRQTAFNAWFGLLERAVNQYLAAGRPQQARKFLNRMKYRFQSRTDQYWRDRYLVELKRRWGHLVYVPKVSSKQGSDSRRE